MITENIQNLCPVCGYQMEEPPTDYNICPSCGTEFGHHDINASIPELREAWIRTGPTWWSKTDPRPSNWDPFQQLARLGVAGPVLSK
jgi:transposase